MAFCLCCVEKAELIEKLHYNVDLTPYQFISDWKV